MNSCSHHHLLQRISVRSLVGAAAIALGLATPSSRAATGVTSYTSTGYIVGLPYPGDTLAFTDDNVQVRNMVSRLRIQSTDARLTRRATVLTHGYYHPDGSSTIYGSWTGEVGTWDLTDPQNPEFTATAGLWDGSWQGLWQPDGSWQIMILGRGTGGAVDGFEMSETAARGPGAIDDPGIAINYTGIVGPAGALNVQLLDDFDDNRVTGWTTGVGGQGSIALAETNQQFTIRGEWHIRTVDPFGTGGGAMRDCFWKVEEGRTLELRADLVGMNEHTLFACLELRGGFQYAYGFMKLRDRVAIMKWKSGYNPTIFFLDDIPVRETAVTLAFALTRSGNNMILTGRVLDAGESSGMLYERSIIDTPDSDPSHGSGFPENPAVSFSPDPPGNPFGTGDRIALSLFQNTDGTLPPAEVTFDNLELRTYDVPLLAIDKAVRLEWPASAFPFTVEGAPAVQGPWLPVLEPVFESGGVKQVAVPASHAMKFFRLK